MAPPRHARLLRSPPRPAQSSPFGGSDHGHAEPVRATARPGCQMQVLQTEPSRPRQREQSLSPWGHICNWNKQVPGSGAHPAPPRGGLRRWRWAPRTPPALSAQATALWYQHCLLVIKPGARPLSFSVSICKTWGRGLTAQGLWALDGIIHVEGCTWGRTQRGA